MKKIPLILNSLFTSLLIGFAALLVARYFLDRTSSFVVAIACAGGIFIILIALGLSKPESREKTDARDKELKQALYSMAPAARLHFLAQLFGFSNPVKEESDGIVVSFPEREVFIADLLRFRPLGADDVTAVYHAARVYGAEPVVLTDVPDKSAIETGAYLGVKIKGWGRVKTLMDAHRAYPRIRRAQKPPRMKKLAGVAFAKNRTKAYLLAALVLLTTSFVTPYSVYYLAGCIVCCLFAAITILRRESPQQDW